MLTAIIRLMPQNFRNYLRVVRGLRFGLPLFLFVLATTFETWEHVVEHENLLTDWLGIMEVLVFGIIGPLLVYWALSYAEKILIALEQSRRETQDINQNLENLVAERTADLEQANRYLKQLDRMKSDFVALVSHELRSPLATLNGGLEVVQQHKALLPARLQRVFELLAGETDRLTQFVATLLDVSQLEAGRLNLTCGPVALFPLLKRATAITLGVDENRVVWQIPPHLPPIWADETYLEQVIRNLLRNAQKYTPPASPIELSAVVQNNGLQISITDHGPGIPPEEQSQIFERFYRRSGDGEKSASGWGLGLYFARTLIEAQHGQLHVHSPVHATPAAPGSRFVICVPLAEEQGEDAQTITD